MRPAKANALAAGVGETVGGTLLALGLATPLASTALTGVMTTAITKVHLPNGPWAANGGWEYNAVLAAALVALSESGPGDLSLDRLRGKATGSTRAALGALALGVASGVAVMELGKRQAPPAAPDQAPQGEPAGDPVTKD